MLLFSSSAGQARCGKVVEIPQDVLWLQENRVNMQVALLGECVAM